MKRLLLALACVSVSTMGSLIAADSAAKPNAANAEKPKASVNPNDKTPNLGLDTQDTTDIFAIQLDSSEEADNLEMQKLEELQAKIQKRREMKQAEKAAAQATTATTPAQTQATPTKK